MAKYLNLNWETLGNFCTDVEWVRTMSAYVSPSPTSPVDRWLYRQLVMEATAATSTTQAPMYSCRDRGRNSDELTHHWIIKRKVNKSTSVVIDLCGITKTSCVDKKCFLPHPCTWIHEHVALFSSAAEKTRAACQSIHKTSHAHGCDM